MKPPRAPGSVQLAKTAVIIDIVRRHDDLDKRLSDRLQKIVEKLEAIKNMEIANKKIIQDIAHLQEEVKATVKSYQELAETVAGMQSKIDALTNTKMVLAGRVADARHKLEKDGRA